MNGALFLTVKMALTTTDIMINNIMLLQLKIFKRWNFQQAQASSLGLGMCYHSNESQAPRSLVEQSLISLSHYSLAAQASRLLLCFRIVIRTHSFGDGKEGEEQESLLWIDGQPRSGVWHLHIHLSGPHLHARVAGTSSLRGGPGRDDLVSM